MTDPLAIRIEAALTKLEALANATATYPSPWDWVSYGGQGGDLSDAEGMAIAQVIRPGVVQFIAAFDPSSVLRLITGMRAILQVVPEIEDMEGQIQGEWGLSTDDPAEINECSNALLRTLASMLGIETNEETND